MTRIAILDDYQNVSQRFADFSRLSADGHTTTTVFNKLIADEDDALVDALAPFDVVCCMRERTRLTAARLQRLPGLKLLVTTGARNAAIDLEAAARQGIIVCGTRASGHAAAELAWALLLGLQRQLVAEDKSMRHGQWQTTIGRDCHGLTLGILGLGRHGANLARFAQAFGMNCIAWSTNLAAARCEELGVALVTKQALFQQSDVISIHLGMGNRNRGIVGQNELAIMKPDALLINTSRGPIVDEIALIDALQSSRIGGAGLDVYDQEPLPTDHPLRSCPNTLLTSHIGFVTQQTYRLFYEDTLAAIEAWLAGSPVRVINP